MAQAGAGRKGGDALLRSAEMIGWALGGIEREIAATRDRLASLTRQAEALRKRLGPAGVRRARTGNGQLGATATVSAGADASAAAAGRGRRGRISAEGRRRIAEAAKRRWAEYRKKKGKEA